MTRCTCTGYSR